MNLHAQILASPGSADFTLLVSATQEDRNVATIASISLDDPKLSERLRDISQAFRMGIRVGCEYPKPT